MQTNNETWDTIQNILKKASQKMNSKIELKSMFEENGFDNNYFDSIKHFQDELNAQSDNNAILFMLQNESVQADAILNQIKMASDKSKCKKQAELNLPFQDWETSPPEYGHQELYIRLKGNYSKSKFINAIKENKYTQEMLQFFEIKDEKGRFTGNSAFPYLLDFYRQENLKKFHSSGSFLKINIWLSEYNAPLLEKIKKTQRCHKPKRLVDILSAALNDYSLHVEPPVITTPLHVTKDSLLKFHLYLSSLLQVFHERKDSIGKLWATTLYITNKPKSYSDNSEKYNYSDDDYYYDNYVEPEIQDIDSALKKSGIPFLIKNINSKDLFEKSNNLRWNNILTLLTKGYLKKTCEFFIPLEIVKLIGDYYYLPIKNFNKSMYTDNEEYTASEWINKICRTIMSNIPKNEAYDALGEQLIIKSDQTHYSGYIVERKEHFLTETIHKHMQKFFTLQDVKNTENPENKRLIAIIDARGKSDKMYLYMDPNKTVPKQYDGESLVCRYDAMRQNLIPSKNNLNNCEMNMKTTPLNAYSSRTDCYSLDYCYNGRDNDVYIYHQYQRARCTYDFLSKHLPLLFSKTCLLDNQQPIGLTKTTSLDTDTKMLLPPSTIGASSLSYMHT